VKRETLSWLASSARFPQRFEDRIGLLCREMSVKRVAELNDLSWDQVCRMEKSYMRRLIEQHPPSEELRVIGIDAISIRKGHPYAIVVADLDQKRPLWLGRTGSYRKGHGSVLRGDGRKTRHIDPIGGYGYVETVSQINPGKCPPCPDCL